MRPLRIAVITAVYTPVLSGISIGVHQRVKYLLQQGHHVFLIHPQIDHQYPSQVHDCRLPGLEELIPFPNFSAFAYPTQPVMFYRSTPEPRHFRDWSDTQVLERFAPDVVVVEEPAQLRGCCSLLWGGYGRAVGTEYARQAGVPIISTFHTDLVAYSRHYLGGWLSRLLRPLMAQWIGHFSQSYDVNLFFSRAQLHKYQQMNAKGCEYLSCQGVDCQQFHPRNIIHDPIPDDSRPLLLFLGRVSQEKSILQLFEALPLIIEKVADVHLAIVGSGPQEDEIRKCAQPYGTSVTVWGESTGTERLGWFARADVFVNPSVTENFCTTNMEALASRTPVVAAAAGGNIEQIIPGHNGFLAEPGNSTDLATQVIKLLESRDLRAEITSRARLSILKFDWANCMQVFEEKLYQLVGASPHPDLALPRLS